MIQGKIFSRPAGEPTELFEFKLTSLNSAEITAIGQLHQRLTVVAGLSPGNCTVIVNASNQYEIAREGVTIDSNPNLRRQGIIYLIRGCRRYTVMMTLQSKPGFPNRMKPGVINASLAQVPEDARTLYRKAVNLIKAGDGQRAIKNVKSAVALSLNPTHTNRLGVQIPKTLAMRQGCRTAQVGVQV